MSDSLWPHESQHARPPCPSPTPRVHPNSCASSQWCHPAISSSGVPFSSCPQSLPESGSFPMSQLFAWGGQSIGVSASASVLPMKTQDWSPLGWTGWISTYPHPKEPCRVWKGKERVAPTAGGEEDLALRVVCMKCFSLQRPNLPSLANGWEVASD